MTEEKQDKVEETAVESDTPATPAYDYEKMAEEIPSNWYEEVELKSISGVVFDNLKSSMNIPPEEVAEMMGCSVEDILDTVAQGSKIYAKMMLFEEKFQEMIETFPKGEKGEVNYPDKVLAKVFGVSADEAVAIFEEHFSIGDVNQVNQTSLAEIRESIALYENNK